MQGTLDRFEMKKEVVNVLKGPRGNDFLKCFMDMSLREASKICLISFSTLKLAKRLNNIQEWSFHELRAGRLHPSKWQEIRDFRELMMEDDYFKNVRFLLVQACKRGQLHQKVSGATPPAPPDAFKQAADLDAKKNNTQQPLTVAGMPQPEQQQRVWNVFTSLNHQLQERRFNHQVVMQALNLQQAQMARLATLAQEASQIVGTLPPAVDMSRVVKVCLTDRVFASKPIPTAAETIQQPIPGDVQPSAVQAILMPPKKSFADATEQVTPEKLLGPADGSCLFKTARPREINQPPRQGVYRETPPKDAKSRMVQAREWMITGDMMFASVPKTLTSEDVRLFWKHAYDLMKTPVYIYTGPEDYLQTRYGLAQYGMESVLVPGPDCQGWPEIEPITEWGWLLTMGLAQ